MKVVVLFNLGGPDSQEAVEPFLYNIFSDPDVIRLPFGMGWLQKPLARYIAKRRGAESRGNYQKIGGSSPLLPNTLLQANRLEALLGTEFRVFIAMRYWSPNADEVVAKMQELQLDEEIEEVIYLPLYPQKSISTTDSSFNDFDRALAAAGLQLPVRRIPFWYEHPHYAELVADTVRGELRQCDLSNSHLLFSAHGIPVSYVTRDGDVYEQHIHATVEAVTKLLPAELSHSLCYQSRVGPVKWLEPDIEDALPRLAEGDKKTILVYPISFVSEHVETLFELDILYGEMARGLGLDYRRLPTLGDRPAFIRLLADLVHQSEVA